MIPSVAPFNSAELGVTTATLPYFALIVWVVLIFASCWCVTRVSKLISPRLEIKDFGLFCLALGGWIICTLPSVHQAIIPLVDAIEYAVSGANLYRDGTFSISLNGIAYPPRYPITFPFLVSGFGSWISGNLAGGVWIVWAMSSLGFVVAYGLSLVISHKRTAGLFTACLFCLVPDFRKVSDVLLMDGPTASLAILIFALFVAMSYTRPTLKDWAAVGVLLAMAVGFRITNIIFVLPFFFCRQWWSVKDTAKNGLLLLTPSIIVAVILASINYWTFGDYLRSGYHAWVSVPYDFFLLTFNLKYIFEWLPYLTGSSLVVLWVVIVGALVSLKKNSQETLGASRQLYFYILLINGSLLAIFLPYFAIDLRFFVPAVVLNSVIGGSIISQCLKNRSAVLPSLCVVLITILVSVTRPTTASITSRIEDLDKILPQNAVLLSGTNPVLLDELFIHHTERISEVVTRRTEYASKFFSTAKPNGILPPSSWMSARYEPLRATGAFDSIPKVFTEDPTMLNAILVSGRPIFVDLDNVTPEELAVLKRSYRIEVEKDNLGKVYPR